MDITLVDDDSQTFSSPLTKKQYRLLREDFLKFVAGRHPTDGAIVTVFSGTIPHKDYAEQYSDAQFLGGGRIEMTDGMTRCTYSSPGCRDLFGRDRPRDSVVAEELLEAIQKGIASLCAAEQST